MKILSTRRIISDKKKEGLDNERDHSCIKHATFKVLELTRVLVYSSIHGMELIPLKDAIDENMLDGKTSNFKFLFLL